jgi:DNA-binding transcriptional ArsR family regulator
MEYLDAILSKSNHAIYFYTPYVSKYTLHFLSLSLPGKWNKIYVSNESSSSIPDELKKIELVSFLTSDFLPTLKGERLRIVVDASSISGEFLPREKYLNEIKEGNSILCTYKISELTTDAIKLLSGLHDRVILTIEPPPLKFEEVSGESVERCIKNNLDVFILSMLRKEPMCGKDIIEKISKDFNILLSAGTVYPLLNILKEKGFLESQRGIKKTIYRILDEEKVKDFIEKQTKANEFLRKF